MAPEEPQSSDTLAAYLPRAFAIELKAASFIPPASGPGIPTFDAETFPTFMHEVAHLVQDRATFRGVMDFLDLWDQVQAAAVYARKANSVVRLPILDMTSGASRLADEYKWAVELAAFRQHREPSAVYLRVAGANNSIVRDARVFLASPWSRRRLTMGPYSMDLRERVAAAIDEGEGSERQIAKRFRVSVSFVTRLLQRRRDAGTLAPKPHGGGPRPVLGFPEQVRLAMLIAEHPDATLNQLKEWGGFACTLTTLWRTLRRFRLTYKKKTLHAGERDTPEVQAKRRRYRAKVRRIEAKRLVFVDETGVNTAMTPTHAWARRGERAEGSVPSSWGSTTVIAALGLDGVRAPLIFPGATDTQAFQTYVDQVLVPELRPGDVVVFDNLKPHLSRHVAESIERAGATVLPLPPYSSDYDPIEELWSKFKGQLRRIAARTKDGLYKAVGETLDSVTIQDILGWFNHSGLYATHG